MRKIFNIQLLSFVLVSVVFLGFTADSQAKKKVKQAFERGIIVLAPASLTVPMQDILREFSKKNNISVSASFDSTAELADQIEQGEPANVFISEDPAKMKDLQQKGLLNVFSIANLTTDRLVLICPKGHFLYKKLKKIKSSEEKLAFISKNILVAIPDPELDRSGVIIQSVFEKLGLWEDMKNKVIKAGNTQNAVYLASHGNTPAIVYESDIKGNDDIQVISKIPEKLHSEIIYQVSIVADITSSSSMKDAEEFVSFMKTKYSVK